MTGRYDEGTAKVSLTAGEWERAGFFGNKRTAFHNGGNHIGAYRNIDFKVKGAEQDTLGVATEYAVVKYLGLDPRECGWCPYSTNKAEWSQPDIAGVIDVRRVTEPHNPLRVYKKDADAKAIVVKTYVDGEDVIVLGWRYAEDVYGKAFAVSNGAHLAYRLEDADTLHEALGAFLSGVAA